MNLDCPGSTFRRQRWLDAGKPVADPRRLSYAGSDSVRWILERVIRQLPPDVAHFCVEAIDWIEVGREAHAWAHHAPAPRALPGDGGHRVSICGVVSDTALPGLLAHEISHRYRKPVALAAPAPMPMASVDMLAIRIYASREYTNGEQRYLRAVWIGARVAEEMRADQQARAWGFDWPGHDYDELRRQFASKYDESWRLARLAAELDDENVDIAACAAAIDRRNV